jgi:putative ABC transport system substrate-binding protein
MTEKFRTAMLWLRSDNLKAAPRTKIGNRKLAGLLAFVIAFAMCGAVGAQPTNIPRIAYLGATSLTANAARVEAFQQGLRELGYVDGKNIAIEFRSAEGEQDRLPALVAELIRLKIDIIVSAGPSVTRAAKEATTTIPIVMTNEGDPVGTGFVASLARPGGNITGLSALAPELNGKRLELLKEIVPNLSRVAVIGSSTEPSYAQVVKEMELAAGALKLKLQLLEVREAKDIETAFQAARKERANAVLLLQASVLNSHRAQVLELAVKNRLPAAYPQAEFVQEGGLMIYAASVTDLFRRAATYVDKILKGRKPADLPVEQPKKFEFIVNLKAAKQIGLTIPPGVLARADRVIK